ncbi:MAG: hypothetical protein EBT81_11445 [Gammaproteobacteria bacterium]|nr:hypothetical protein [Gammaproteobacteria bacterium]
MLPIFQEVRGGTGHAVRIALKDAVASGTVIVCAGDTPLLTGASLQEFIKAHTESGAASAVLAAQLEASTSGSGYRRWRAEVELARLLLRDELAEYLGLVRSQVPALRLR